MQRIAVTATTAVGDVHATAGCAGDVDLVAVVTAAAVKHQGLRAETGNLEAVAGAGALDTGDDIVIVGQGIALPIGDRKAIDRSDDVLFRAGEVEGVAEWWRARLARVPFLICRQVLARVSTLLLADDVLPPTIPEDHRVAAGAGGERIVAVVAVNGVCAAKGRDDIVAAAAMDGVRACIDRDLVVPTAALQRGAAVTHHDDRVVFNTTVDPKISGDSCANIDVIIAFPGVIDDDAVNPVEGLADVKCVNGDLLTAARHAERFGAIFLKSVTAAPGIRPHVEAHSAAFFVGNVGRRPKRPLKRPMQVGAQYRYRNI